MKKKNSYIIYIALLGLLVTLALGGCRADSEQAEEIYNQAASAGADGISLADIPPYDGELSVELSGNVPSFPEEEITTEPFERYSELDELGRCGTAYANICEELMPTEPRGDIGMIKPTGWHTVKYDSVDGNYLYNRCHLIAFMLAGENDNEKNLITGTRYFNVEGMLPFEQMVADYVEESGGHVLYRVTPGYQGDNLVASGVMMEAYSVEDAGAGVCFCVYVYNVQPGVEIDYATGESRLASEMGGADGAAQPDKTQRNGSGDADGAFDEQGQQAKEESGQYILNQNTHKFHTPDCGSAADIKPQNRAEYEGSRAELVRQGYEPCGRCRP